MSKTEVHAGPPPVLEQFTPCPDEIRFQLRTILGSSAFLASKRSSQFLEHVCERCLAGDIHALKERSLAIAVFGRSPQSDLGEDTIVRVGAREVRKRLAVFYASAEGAAAPVVIDLARGTYVPEFRFASAGINNDVPLDDPPIDEIPTPRIAPAVWISALAVAAAFVIFAIFRFTAVSPNAAAFAHFWEPVVRNSDPLLLAVGNPIVYFPSARAVKLNESRLPPLSVPAQRVLQLRPEELTGADLIPVVNQYVGFGDMVAGTEVASMLAARSKTSRIRLASDVSFADLRQSSALLIGAFTNRWTMELEPAWRFQFRRSAEQKTVIVDTVNDAKTPSSEFARQWGFSSNEDASASTDYVLVCRILNASSRGLLIVAAGVRQFGTEAAGRLLADPEQLGSVLRKLPAKWEGKNVQLVLRTRVIGNTPAEPELVAWNVW